VQREFFPLSALGASKPSGSYILVRFESKMLLVSAVIVPGVSSLKKIWSLEGFQSNPRTLKNQVDTDALQLA